MTDIDELVGTVDALVLVAVAGVSAGQGAQRHRPRHEAEIGVRFAGPDKLVHLVGLGEVVARGAPPPARRSDQRRLQQWESSRRVMLSDNPKQEREKPMDWHCLLIDSRVVSTIGLIFDILGAVVLACGLFVQKRSNSVRQHILDA